MKKIKLCIIVTKLELGGAQKVAISLCQKINLNKFEPFLICGCGGILDKEIEGKIKVYFIRDLVREISPLKDFKALVQIYKILKQEKPDIVHTHSSKAGIIGRLGAKFARVPNIIHTIHGFSFNDTQRILKKKLFIFFERAGAKISKYLIPVSIENINKGLKNNIGKKEQYRYIRLGIDIDNFKNYQLKPSLREELKLQNNDVIVTTIGPFKPQKNLTDFIKIANNIIKNNKNFKFIVVGDGEGRKDLEILIAKFNISNNVILLGWRKDISNILNSSDIFVMTSLWEGLPISTIEAMSCGLAPIVNAVDGQLEIIEDNQTGFLIKPYDIKTAVEKILLLANNIDIRKQMGQKAKDSIDNTFSIDYMIKQHEKLYSAIFH
ncbi:MAG: glycosyltransferase family 4 protein [Endomicrobiaceae bacterium]|nr:glycosyltransferase family 4 protein [Endomicrobiaceae bacterium]